MKQGEVSRNSMEYAEIVAEVFVETVQKAAREAMYCEYDGEEITASLMECLQYVYLHGASPIRRIAEGLEVSLSAGSQLVDRVVRRGLVTRRESESDRRLTEVDLTDAGRGIVEQMRKRRSEWFASMVDAMPESRREAMLSGLEAFLKIALASEDNIDRACVRCGMEHVAFCVVNKVRSERTETRDV